MARRTVLITGITGGMGQAIAKEFAGHGWDVLGQYAANEDAAQKLLQELKGLGARGNFFRADMTAADGVRGFITQLGDSTVDTLVNNAGGYVRQRDFLELTIEDLSDVFMLNTFSGIMIAQHLLPQMKKRGFGRIVNISSLAAKYGGSSGSVAYGCAKRALEGLTRSLAREGAASNILVNTVRPGVIDTPFHKRFPKKNMDERIQMIPLKRLGQAKDVAGAVYFLGSDANEYVTNETLAVAGGE